jgi:protein SCO1/2
MKARSTIIGFSLFTGLLIAAGLVLTHHPSAAKRLPAEQVFHVNGVVRSLESDGKTVVIEHEDIPGFMPSMTMPFTVKEPATLRELKTGDPVRFDLIVTKDDSWIASINRKNEAGAVRLNSSGSSSSKAVSVGSEELQTGQNVPDFAVTDENGHQVHLHDYQGKAVLITFVYTRCPLPNYCPLMSRNFASLQERLGKECPDRFHLITISFDPAHDTPEVLKHYAEAFTQDESTWTFAAGTLQQVQQLAGEFGLVYLPEAGTITHDLRTALIAPDGRLVHVWRSNVWTPYEVQRWVKEVLAPDSGSPFASAASAAKPHSRAEQYHD